MSSFTLTQSDARTQFERYSAGASLREIADEHETTRSKMLSAICKALGMTRADWNAVRGGSRNSSSATRAAPVANIDDSDVPRITSTRYADGWRMRKHGGRVIDTDMGSYREGAVDVYISPQGVEYVRARANERADLIREWTARERGLGDALRLRLLDTSNTAKRAAALEAAQAEQQREHEQRAAAKRAEKRAAKDEQTKQTKTRKRSMAHKKVKRAPTSSSTSKKTPAKKGTTRTRRAKQSRKGK